MARSRKRAPAPNIALRDEVFERQLTKAEAKRRKVGMATNAQVQTVAVAESVSVPATSPSTTVHAAATQSMQSDAHVNYDSSYLTQSLSLSESHEAPASMFTGQQEALSEYAREVDTAPLRARLEAEALEYALRNPAIGIATDSSSDDVASVTATTTDTDDDLPLPRVVAAGADSVFRFDTTVTMFSQPSFGLRTSFDFAAIKEKKVFG